MVLIVRTKNQLADTEAFFKKAGLKTQTFAISTTEPLPITIPDEATGILFTSANAVESAPMTDLPVYCVGITTAKTALKKGFKVVLAGHGGSDELAELILERCMPCTLFHPAAENADLSWHKKLAEAGFEILTSPAYKTSFVDTWPKGLKANETAVFFSSKGLRHFCDLAQKQPVDLKPFTAVCLSAKVAKNAVDFGTVKTAEQPTLESILNEL